MLNIIRTPHDEFVKEMMEHPKVAKDFFENHLPKEIQDKIILDTLRPEKGSFIDPDLKKHDSDLIFSVELVNHDKALLYMLIEHQSKPDELMPFRLMYYIFQGLKRHVLQNEKKPLPLPLIYPLVLYNGTAPYNESKDIFPLFGQFESLAREVFFAPFQLIDVATLSDDDIRKHRWAGLMELSLKRAQHLQFESWIKLLSERLEAIHVEIGDDLINIVLQYGLRKYEIARAEPKMYLDTIRKALAPQYEGNIMTLEQAIKTENLQHTLLAIALLKSGHSIDAVAKETDLTAEDVKKIQQSILH